MSPIHDLIRTGSLTEAGLNNYLTGGNNCNIEEQDSQGLTPLCLACLKNQLKSVQILLKNPGCKVNTTSSKNRSALWFASNLPYTGRGIVNHLLENNADPNIPSDDKEFSTPLRRAAMHSNIEKAEALLRAGAKIDIAGQNDKNDLFAALQKRKRSGKKGQQQLIDLLKLGPLPSIEKAYIWAAGLVSIFINYMIFMVNSISGAFAKIFNVQGKSVGGPVLSNPDENVIVGDAAVPAKEIEMFTGADPKENFKKMEEFMGQSALGSIFDDQPDYLSTVSKKAAALANDPTTDLGNSDNIEDMIQLALFQTILFCGKFKARDGSMAGSRLRAQNELIARIVKIATKLQPDDKLTEVRFINTNAAFHFNGDSNIEGELQGVAARGGTPLGAKFKEKIIRPYVYEAIKNKTFKNPLLIAVITDGEPSDNDRFKGVLKECYDYIRDETNLEANAVLRFQVNQVGDDAGAEEFIRGLQSLKNPEIYCTSGEL
ncbi:hypothetical protein TWF281_002692 [Arthrobotrys megalospora]